MGGLLDSGGSGGGSTDGGSMDGLPGYDGGGTDSGSSGVWDDPADDYWQPPTEDNTDDSGPVETQPVEDTSPVTSPDTGLTPGAPSGDGDVAHSEPVTSPDEADETDDRRDEAQDDARPDEGGGVGGLDGHPNQGGTEQGESGASLSIEMLAVAALAVAVVAGGGFDG